MARIPDLQQSQRVQGGQNPVPIASTGADRASGEAIADAGRGLFNLGAALVEKESREKAIKRSFDINEFKQGVQRKALEFNDVVLRTGAADGSNYTKMFNAALDSYIEENAAGFEDELTKQGAINEAQEVRNYFNSHLSEVARKRFVDNGKSRIESQMHAAASLIFATPGQAELQAKGFFDLLEKPETKDLVPPDQLETIKVTARKQFAAQEVRGLIEQTQFAAAKQALLKNGSSFDANEHKKLGDEVDDAQIRFDNAKLREQDRRDKEIEKANKALRQQTFHGLVSVAAGANTAEARANLQRLADTALAAGRLDNADYNLILGIRDKRTTVESDRMRVHFTDKIITGAPFDKTRREVIAAHNSGSLDSQDATAILNQLDVHQRRKESDPSFDRKMIAAKGMLDAHFGKEFVTIDDKPRLILKATAVTDFMNLVNQGSEPEAAANQIVRKYLGGIHSAPIVPGVSHELQFDDEKLSEAARQLQVRHQNGQLNKGEYRRRLQMIQERRKAIEREAMEQKGKSR